MADFNYKRISDPVHGAIGLSELEVRVLDTKVFQRLRNVKQLGLAYYVFPGADYSRFAHSIGVCHVTGLTLKALKQNCGAVHSISDKDVQLYRLAALLHDIGHYPYSHAMEEAVENYYSAQLIKPKSATAADTNKEPEKLPKFYKHERVGKEVLIQDKELPGIIKGAGFDIEEVYSIITREKPLIFTNLINSDLDADRIDYLLRTAHHTGLPYGSIDLEYLLSQTYLDNSKRICLKTKALRTADHFLLSRYFDYQQVTFHKTVVAFELLLKDVLNALLSEKKIEGSSEWISQTIRDNKWNTYDDTFILQKIRDLNIETSDFFYKNITKAILERISPKMVAQVEFLAPRDESTHKSFRLQKKILKGKIGEWASKFSIDKRFWYIWDKSGMALTKVGSYMPISSVIDNCTEDKDKYEQAVRVLTGQSSAGISKPIMEIDNSLMKILANYALYSLRVYVLFPDDKSKKQEITETIKDEFPDMNWK